MRNRRCRERCLAILTIVLCHIVYAKWFLCGGEGETRSAAIAAHLQRGEEVAQANPTDNEEKRWVSFAYALLVVYMRMHNAEMFIVASVTHSDIAYDVLPSRRRFKAWHDVSLSRRGETSCPGFLETAF